MKNIFLTIIIAAILSLSSCAAETTPIKREYNNYAEFEIHSFSAAGADMSLIFCCGSTLLIDNSFNDAEGLIPAYLDAMGISCPDYVLQPDTPVPDDGFRLGKSYVNFTEGEEETTEVHITYETAVYSFPLAVSAQNKENASQNPSVTVIKVYPDAVQSEMQQISLYDVIGFQFLKEF